MSPTITLRCRFFPYQQHNSDLPLRYLLLLSLLLYGMELQSFLFCHEDFELVQYSYLTIAAFTISAFFSHFVLVVQLFDRLCDSWAVFYIFEYGNIVFLASDNDINRNEYEGELIAYENALHSSNPHF